MATLRHAIRKVPLRGGLVTAGQQSMVDEGQLWEAENISVGLDGGLVKRPGLQQWGQTLKTPRGTMRMRPLFNNVDAWTPSSSDDDFVVDTLAGVWRATVTGALAAPSTVTYSLAGDDPVTSVVGVGLRTMMRFSNLPSNVYMQLAVRPQLSDNMIELRIRDQGFYYYNGTEWRLLYAYDVAGAGAIAVSYWLDAGTLHLELDEVLVASAPDAATQAAESATAHIEVTFETNTGFEALTGVNQYTTFLWDMMLGSGAEPFGADSVVDGISFDTSGSSNAITRRMLVATSEYLYVDSNLRGTWVPLLSLVGHSIYFTRFGDKLVVFDSGTVYAWNGVGDVEVQDDAPKVRFGGVYKSRLFAAGDVRHPRRLYFTATNQSNVWFSPEDDADGAESVEEVLNAGFIVMPDDEVVTAVYGEFYNSCVFMTRNSIGRIVGSSPLSFAREFISRDNGAAGPRCVAQAGNDLVILGPSGVTTLKTVVEYGDLQTQMPSGAVADLWASRSNSNVRVNIDRLDRASLAWSPTESLLYVCFQPMAATAPELVYVWHLATGSWYGPWTTGSRFVRDVIAASPAIKAIMHGSSVGRVGVSSQYLRSDYDEPYTSTVMTASLSGRSLDPQLHAMQKKWRRMRLHLLPRGNWDLLVRWKIDGDTYQQRIDAQNVYNLPTLTSDFRLDTRSARLSTDQLSGYIDIALDARGQMLTIEVSTVDTYTNEDFIFQGYEVEFTTDSYEEAE